MRVIFLGSGSAFTVGEGNFQSNLVVESGDRRLLIDCGGDVRHSLHARGYSYRDIDDVYVSHLHSDHIGGLEYLGFASKFDPTCERPGLFIAEHLVEPLWKQTLSGGMSDVDDGHATLETFFDVEPVPVGGSFRWQGVDFELVAVPHVTTDARVMNSHGLFFDAHGVKIFLTTDAQFAPEVLAPQFERADIIFHDTETTSRRTGVHANYQDLRTLPRAVKRKMWLYHYNVGPLPDAAADGFLGFVRSGQCFDLAEQVTPSSRRLGHIRVR